MLIIEELCIITIKNILLGSCVGKLCCVLNAGGKFSCISLVTKIF